MTTLGSYIILWFTIGLNMCINKSRVDGKALGNAMLFVFRVRPEWAQFQTNFCKGRGLK